ncbi:MAG: hypothetical protein ACFCU6_15895 [Balneolaceae bacterium]
MKRINLNNIKGTIICSVIFLTLCINTELLTAQNNNLTELVNRAVSAGIDKSEFEILQTRAANSGITDDQLVQIIEPALIMAEQNLPAELVFQKALEGIAKGVPASRMIPVLDGLRQNAEQASSIVDPWLQRPEVESFLNRNREQAGINYRTEMLKAGVKTLSQSVPSEVLQSVLDEIGKEAVLSKTTPASILVGVNIIGDLPSTAVQPEATGTLISKTLSGGFRADDMQKLPGAMNAAQRRSQLPAASIIEGVTSQLQGGIPANQILQNLFNGNVSIGPPGNIPRGLENRPGRGRGNN